MIEINGEEVPVEQFREDWALALMEQGVLVRLNICRWRGEAKLEYDELGIIFSDQEHTDFMKKYITLGKEKLCPPRVMNRIKNIELRSRNCLKNHSFKTVWGHFVPYHRFLEWKTENDEIKEEFFQLARDIGEEYFDIVSEVKRDYENMARDLWKRCYPEEKKDPPQSFIENFTSNIADKIPSREDIIASFKYSETFFTIPLPSFVQEEINKTEKLVQELEYHTAANQIKIETKRIIENEYREKKKELIDSFLDSTVVYLRGQIGELARNTLVTLKRNEKDLSRHSVKKIRSMISKVRNLNFYSDKEINDILKELEVEVEKYRGERDKEVLEKSLASLARLVEEEYVPDESQLINFVDI